MLAKVFDGARMVWEAMDDRERVLLVYGAAVALWAVASALSTPRRHDRDDQPATLPVVVVVREKS